MKQPSVKRKRDEPSVTTAPKRTRHYDAVAAGEIVIDDQPRCYKCDRLRNKCDTKCVTCDKCSIYDNPSTHHCGVSVSICMKCNKLITSKTRRCTSCLHGRGATVDNSDSNELVKISKVTFLNKQKTASNISMDLTKEDSNMIPQDYLALSEDYIAPSLNAHLLRDAPGPVKVNCRVLVKLQKLMPDGSYEFNVSNLKTDAYRVNPHDGGIDETAMSYFINSISNSFDVNVHAGSGWGFNKLLEVQFQSVQAHKLGKNVVGTWHQMPAGKLGQTEIVNLMPETDDCDYNCVEVATAYHFASKHDVFNNEKKKMKTNRYKRVKELPMYKQELDKLNFPEYENKQNRTYTLEQIPEIEQLNKVSFRIYKLLSYKRWNQRLNKHEQRHTLVNIRKGGKAKEKDRNITLLYIKDSHVAYVKNEKNFIKKFFDIRGNRQICLHCFTLFRSQYGLDLHSNSKICTHNSTFETQVYLPPHGSKLKFESWNKTVPPYLVCYADTEAKMIPTQTDENTDNNTKIVHVHEMLSFAYTIINGITGEVLKKGTILQGDGVSTKIVDELQKEAAKYLKEFEAKECVNPMLNGKDWKIYDNTTHCPYCKLRFNVKEKKKEKHRHHNHLIHGAYILDENGSQVEGEDGYPKITRSNFISAACMKCNIQQTNKRKNLDVFLHNSGGYDLQLFLKDIDPSKYKSTFILPKTSHNKLYMFKVDNITFKDSLNFLPFGLDKLAELNVINGGGQRKDSLPITVQLLEANNIHNSVIEKVINQGKGFFPYEYITSSEKLKEGLPPIDKFTSTITGPMKCEDYKFLEDMFKMEHGPRTLQDLHDIYILTDVGILADCFENYRGFCRDTWGLDPANYVTSSSLYLDAALKQSGQELELITDPEIYERFELSITGGFVTVVQRKATANNIEMGENYDGRGEIQDIYILDLDFNQMYAGIQSKAVPVGGFRMMSGMEVREFEELLHKNLITFSDEDPKGCMVECTFSIPDKVARENDELPLSVFVAKYIKGSDHSRNLSNGKSDHQSNKLIASHLTVENTFLHIEVVLYLIEKGAKLVKVHQVCEFNQSKFLEKHIEKNRQLRVSSEYEIYKSILKLANNAPFGKTIERKRKQNVRCRFVKGCNMRVNARDVYFKGFTAVGNDNFIVEKNKRRVCLNAPLYVGTVVLQRSKVQYWRFYDKLKAEFCGKVYLLYGDTDSMMLKFVVDKGTTLKQMIDNSSILSEYLDQSNMTGDLYNNQYKGQFNKLKSETGCKIITEGIFLKPKLYSLTVQDGPRKLAMKGISTKNGNPIEHSHFQEILDNTNLKIFTTQARIQKKGENMCTVQQKKLALSVLDLKRHWTDLYTSYGIGHPDIRTKNGGGSQQGDVIPFRYNLHNPHHNSPLHEIIGPPLNFDAEPDHETEDSLFGWSNPSPSQEDNESWVDASNAHTLPGRIVVNDAALLDDDDE